MVSKSSVPHGFMWPEYGRSGQSREIKRDRKLKYLKGRSRKSEIQSVEGYESSEEAKAKTWGLMSILPGSVLPTHRIFQTLACDLSRWPIQVRS